MNKKEACRGEKILGCVAGDTAAARLLVAEAWRKRAARLFDDSIVAIAPSPQLMPLAKANRAGIIVNLQ